MFSLGQEQELRWNIIKSGLPVTLLQCLHLFFFSANLEVAPWDRGEEEEQQALRETQEMLVQVGGSSWAWRGPV